MAYTTIDKSSLHFNTKLYAGNSGTQAITGVGHQPDLVWIKNRNDTNNQSHVLYDAVRGVTKYLSSNSDAAEGTEAAGVTAFGTDGFTVGNTVTVNTGFNYVAWNWKAGGGAGSSNTDGSITATVSANTTAGFSIVKYTGTGANATVGHGLGVAPKMILFKDTTNGSTYWGIYNKDIGNENRLTLNNDSATQGTSANYYQSTDPTTSVFSIGSNSRANASSAVTIAYCFADITGFSKIGSYIGNGAANGPVVYTGFKPSWVLIKSVSTTDWNIYDNKRLGYNGGDAPLFANLSNSEATDYNRIDFLSNGFKIRTSNAQVNNDNTTMVFMAFGQTIASSNNIAATAR